MKLNPTASAIAISMLVLASPAYADNHHHDLHAQIVNQPLDVINIGGTAPMNISVGFGSGAFHFPGDDRNTIYTLTDRGTNISCSDDVKLLGAEICDAGKIFLDPGFAPSIYKFQKSPRLGWQATEVIRLKDSAGHPVTGLPNPLTVTDTEQAFDINGRPVEFDPEGVDTEGMVRLADGTFWLVEEYGPSLVHVSRTGEILQRVVPVSVTTDLLDANYGIEGKLPDILKRRKLNRGIESIAVSPNEDYLYFMLQSPLANPDNNAYKKSRNVRLFKFHRETMQVVGEWVYQLDLPDTFADDPGKKQNDVKISEMVAVDEDKLIILERISKTTKLYKVDLSSGANILGEKWDNEMTLPSLEQIADLHSVEITPLAKELVMDSARDYPGLLPSKVEGMALLDNNTMILMNDNDFGIEGDKIAFIRIRLNTGHHE